MLFLMCVWIRVHHKCTHQPGHSDAACSSRPALGTALSGSGPLPRQPRPRSTCPPLPQCAAPPATPRKGASGIGHCHQGELVPGTGRKAASCPRWHLLGSGPLTYLLSCSFLFVTTFLEPTCSLYYFLCLLMKKYYSIKRVDPLLSSMLNIGHLDAWRRRPGLQVPRNRLDSRPPPSAQAWIVQD